MIEFIKEWLQSCIETRSHESLERLLGKFTSRHGFSRKNATAKQLCQADLEAKKVVFAADFWPCQATLPVGDTTVYTTAREKRMATVLRAIEAWEDITPECIRAAPFHA
ncbi:hypothetical protein ACHHYP_20418 [Achlya hypogyna]|uniref:Uncharacterized protein n=1 Tax=Achlya hypogyna TaxID=1202772 RepID=A0A1V9YNH8_ACHHY|nr:hypothetical protein ACHHYP_20418 [Achlya hypogyna]